MAPALASASAPALASAFDLRAVKRAEHRRTAGAQSRPCPSAASLGRAPSSETRKGPMRGRIGSRPAKKPSGFFAGPVKRSSRAERAKAPHLLQLRTLALRPRGARERRLRARHPSNVSSTAIRAATPLATWRRIHDCGPSATSSVISTPRFIGPGCSTTASVDARRRRRASSP